LQDLAGYWRRQHDVRVVGVTGSVGKTTTKELIADLLAQDSTVLRTPANLNTEIGVPLSLMQLSSGQRFAVVEMAMYDVGDIRRLTRIAAPEVGVVTNVQPSHLQRLGSIERIAQAKAEIVQELPPAGLALLNADDEHVRRMASLTAARVLLYGLTPDADIWADDIKSRGLKGTEFTVHYRRRTSESFPAQTRLIGAHLVPSALAAVAVAVHFGMSLERAVAGLSNVGPGLRLVVGEGMRGSTVLDDSYNASPASMMAALDVLAEIDGRHIAVLGDMLELGSFELEGHHLVGHRAASAVQRLLTVGVRAQAIAQGARDAGLRLEAVDSFECNDQIIRQLHEELQPGDVVLVKGSRAMRLDEVARAIAARPHPINELTEGTHGSTSLP
jgi:UDP-N-acetylmuramoyl-tripeptide--D-alanyl-D-alanine ligase